MKLFDQNPWARYVFALLSVTTALLLRYSLTPVLGFDAPLLIFTLSVAVSALFGGFGAGLTATVLSMILGDYFFIKGTAFIPEKTSDLARLGLFAIVGILISYLSHLRFHAVRATAEARTALQESETALSRNQAKLLESERVAREEAEERWREAEMLQNVSRRLVATLDSEKIFSISAAPRAI
jgi:K+-sensing histidine kinase KdpD